MVLQNAAAIMGVRVSETNAEKMMVTARVTANSRNRRPTMSAMNSSGISTAMSETVSETIVNPISAEPLQRGLHWGVAHFDIARDVFDHDDRVVHDEAGRDGQRHQGKVIEAVAEQVHDGECANQRERHGDAGNDGGRQRCAETEKSP